MTNDLVAKKLHLFISKQSVFALIELLVFIFIIGFLVLSAQEIQEHYFAELEKYYEQSRTGTNF